MYGRLLEFWSWFNKLIFSSEESRVIEFSNLNG
jgi:hypothetical protein